MYKCLNFHESFSKNFGQCVHEGVSWRRPLLCTCSPYILWSSLRGKKGKFWKFEKSFGSEHVSPLFFFLLLAPLPSPTATAPHYALQNRRIYFCILFKNIKILRPIVFIFGIFPCWRSEGKKENSKSSRRALAQSMSVFFFFLLLVSLVSPNATDTSFVFCSEISRNIPLSFHFASFFLMN